jgi:hypothetical protein
MNTHQAIGPSLANALEAATFIILIITAISISLKNRINQGTLNQFSLQGSFLPTSLSISTLIRAFSSGNYAPLIPVLIFFAFLYIQQYLVSNSLTIIAGYRQDSSEGFLQRTVLQGFLRVRFKGIAESFKKEQIGRRSREVRESVIALLVDSALLTVIVAGALLLFASHGIEFVDNVIASLALLLIGLVIMIRADDIVTQVMGLSVAFNGLYIAGFTFLIRGTSFGINAQLQALLFALSLCRHHTELRDRGLPSARPIRLNRTKAEKKDYRGQRA